MRSSASSLLALSAGAFVLAGCGGRAVFDGARVQAAFEASGIHLDPRSTHDIYYTRPDLEELVDEAFYELQDFISRRVEVLVLVGDGEDLFVVVYGGSDDARRERALVSAATYERQGLFIRQRGNVVAFVDRERLDAAEAALDSLD